MTTANNPVVTPEMIEAGVEAYGDDALSGNRKTAKRVEAIYLAMTQASPPPDEMVERAARAMFEHEWAPCDPLPEDEWKASRGYWLSQARAALQSIGPLMRERDELGQQIAEAMQKARDECGGDPVSFAYAEAAMRSALKRIEGQG